MDCKPLIVKEASVISLEQYCFPITKRLNQSHSILPLQAVNYLSRMEGSKQDTLNKGTEKATATADEPLTLSKFANETGKPNLNNGNQLERITDHPLTRKNNPAVDIEPISNTQTSVVDNGFGSKLDYEKKNNAKKFSATSEVIPSVSPPPRPIMAVQASQSTKEEQYSCTKPESKTEPTCGPEGSTTNSKTSDKLQKAREKGTKEDNQNICGSGESGKLLIGSNSRPKKTEPSHKHYDSDINNSSSGTNSREQEAQESGWTPTTVDGHPHRQVEKPFVCNSEYRSSCQEPGLSNLKSDRENSSLPEVSEKSKSGTVITKSQQHTEVGNSETTPTVSEQSLNSTLNVDTNASKTSSQTPNFPNYPSTTHISLSAGPPDAAASSTAIASAETVLPAHVPVLKGTPKSSQVGLLKDQEEKVIVGAEKLRVRQAELLHASIDLLGQQNQIEVKSREEVIGRAPPQVAIIPPIMDFTRSHEYRSLAGQQRSSAIRMADEKDNSLLLEKSGNMTYPTAHRSDEKSLTRPVARRIWMSSCRPLDPASLERIGIDSKGNVYWYDGGKNMFLSPSSSDSAYKPSESELQLACKSMVQWTAKLKELRMSSDHQADTKLAQTIKDQYLNRVRVATQRKPRDVSVLQNLQAVHVTGSDSQMKQQAQVSKQHLVALPASDLSKAPQFVKSTFPQGSILVVPHPTHPFQVLPMFGSTAMIMQQALPTISTVAGKIDVSLTDSALPSSATNTSVPESLKFQPEVKLVSALPPQSLVPPSSISVREDPPASSSSLEVTMSEPKSSKRSTQPSSSEPVSTPSNTSSLKAHPLSLTPMIIPQTLPGTMLPTVIPQPHGFPQAYTVANLAFPQVFPLKVAESVKMEDISFESRSIEITGEVPIRKVLIRDSNDTVSDGDNNEVIQVVDANTDRILAGRATVGSSQEFKGQTKEAVSSQLNVFGGHSSAEVMSARLLLSLTERSDKVWPTEQLASPGHNEKGTLREAFSQENPPPSPPAASIGPPPASTGRKRKQTPIASAKNTDQTSPMADRETLSAIKNKKGRKPKITMGDADKKITPKRKTPLKKMEQSKGQGSGQGLSAEDQISGSVASPAPLKSKTPTSKPKLTSLDGESILSETSQATASLLQLKAARISMPMKEYVIETDSDSDSSSSGSSTSHASQNSESSSDSSSDSSSEDADRAKVTQQKRGLSGRGRGIGRGRGRGRGRGGTIQKKVDCSIEKVSSNESSQGESSPSKTKSRRGCGRGAPRAQRSRGGVPQRRVTKRTAESQQVHIVSIPINVLHNKQLSGLKRKVQEVEAGKPSENKNKSDFTPDVPTDLASLYAQSGGVDLDILSELTKSVAGNSEGDAPNSRSKRTCVRVRQEITKLQEILKDTGEYETKASPVGAGSKSRPRGKGKAQSGGRSSDVGQQEPAVGSLPAQPRLKGKAQSGDRSGDVGQQDTAGGNLSKKYKRPSYSQFTHKRRKRKRKLPEEEEALWQPARQQIPNDKLSPVYVFSTNWANQAANAVINGDFGNIILFHKAQPKSHGYLTLSSNHQQSGTQGQTLMEQSRSEPSENEAENDTEKSPIVTRRSRSGSGVKNDGLAKVPRDRRLSTQANEKSTPLSTNVRSSQRLRKQKINPEPEKYVSSGDESSSHEYHSPSPVPQARQGRSSLTGRPGLRTRNSRRKPSLPEHQQVQSPDGRVDSGRESPSVEENDKDETAHLDSKMVSSDDDQFNSEEESFAKKPRVNDSHGNGSFVDSSPDHPPSTSQLEPTGIRKEDINYTICHGTPGHEDEGTTKHRPELDHSWQSQQHVKLSRVAKEQASGSLSDATPTTPLVSSETIFSPEMASSESSSKNAVAVEQGGGLSHMSSVVPDQRHQHRAFPSELDKNQREPPSWGAANLASQFHGVPPYPPVYNPALHGMAYPPHAAHGANYPYPMPYSWGHGPPAPLGASNEYMHHNLAKSQDYSRHMAHSAEGHQYSRGADGAASPGVGHVEQISATSSSSLHHQHRAQVEHKSGSIPQGYTPESLPAHGAPKPVPMDKIPHPNTFPSPSLHQLVSPVSSSSSLPHQMTHPFAPHGHVLSPDNLHVGMHPSHPAHFPYSFEHGTPPLQPMHLWQTQQMQQSSMHPIAGLHPSHLPAHLPAHSLWYTHPQSMSQFVPGGEVPSHYKKSGKNSKSVSQEKASSNQNANNNVPGVFPRAGPHLAKYQMLAFRDVSNPSRQESSSFSMEHLQAPASKEEPLRSQSSLSQVMDGFDSEDSHLSMSSVLDRTQRTSSDVNSM